MTYRDAAACVPTTRMLLTLIAAPQGGFAHDSPLGGRWIRTSGSAMRTANSAALVMPPDLPDFRAKSGRIPSRPALGAPRNRRIAPEPHNSPDLRGVFRYYRRAKILNEAGR